MPLTRPIGYYVHHQGWGHWQRACLVARALSRPVTLIGTFGALREIPTDIETLDLPDDRMNADFSGQDDAGSRPDAFHYAPLNVDGIRQRMHMIAMWCATNDPALFIVDVSVEVALFVRLLSVPTAVMRLAGPRVDCAHLEAFRAADVVLAPFPRVFESRVMPAWVCEKTVYGGFLAHPVDSAERAEAQHQIVAVVLSRGGNSVDATLFEAAAAATPAYDWHIFGSVGGTGACPPNVHFRGWCHDIGPMLDQADLIIGGAGDGLLADVAVRAKRFICIPEDRAFEEQRDKAATLAAGGMALVLNEWPPSEEWPLILQRAAEIDPMKLHAHTDDCAVTRFAAAIETAAARHDPRMDGPKESATLRSPRSSADAEFRSGRFPQTS